MKSIPYTGIIYILAISVILVIPAAIFGLCSLFDFRLMHGAYDPMHLELSFENAPEGTVLMMPLIKSENGEYISISAYCEDMGDGWLRLSGSETPEELQKRLGAFKADGSALTFSTGENADWQIAVLLAVFLLEPLTIIILVVLIISAAINSVCEKINERKRS